MNVLKKLIGNKVTEKELREYLTLNGFDGRGAKIARLELAAIQRPGWVQVFKFEVKTRDDQDEWHEFFGLIRDDERHQMQVLLTTFEEEREDRFQEWSEGLFKAQQQPLTTPQKWMFLLFGAVMLLAVVSAAISNLAQN